MYPKLDEATHTENSVNIVMEATHTEISIHRKAPTSYQSCFSTRPPSQSNLVPIGIARVRETVKLIMMPNV